MRKSTKITAALGGVALTVATAGAAYAYWTTSGSGTGTATGASNYATALAISSTVPTTSLVVPGSSNAISVTVVNPNSGEAYANTVSGVVSLVGGDKTNCKAADFTVDSIPSFGSIPTGTTGVTKSSSLHFASTSVSQDDCKGVGISIAWSSN